MTLKTWIASVENARVDKAVSEVLERVYGGKLPSVIHRHFSTYKDGVSFDGKDGFYALSFGEVMDSAEQLRFDFASRRIFPFLDIGDNDYIGYDCSVQTWVRVNTVDDIVFDQTLNLREWLD